MYFMYRTPKVMIKNTAFGRLHRERLCLFPKSNLKASCDTVQRYTKMKLSGSLGIYNHNRLVTGAEA